MQILTLTHLLNESCTKVVLTLVKYCISMLVNLLDYVVHTWSKTSSSNLHTYLLWISWYLDSVKECTYQSGIIVSQDAHSDLFPLESLGEYLMKMSIANSSYSSLCCGVNSSRDSNLIKALQTKMVSYSKERTSYKEKS